MEPPSGPASSWGPVFSALQQAERCTKNVAKTLERRDRLTGLLAAAADLVPKEPVQRKLLPDPSLLLRGELRSYQRQGFSWLASLYDAGLNGILADEMGLGKTIQTIALLCWLAAEKGVWGPHLVVVPNAVLYNWGEELKKWAPGLKLLVYRGTVEERKVMRKGWSAEDGMHVCVVTYGTACADITHFRYHFDLKEKYFMYAGASSGRTQYNLMYPGASSGPTLFLTRRTISEM